MSDNGLSAEDMLAALPPRRRAVYAGEFYATGTCIKHGPCPHCGETVYCRVINDPTDPSGLTVQYGSEQRQANGPDRSLRARTVA